MTNKNMKEGAKTLTAAEKLALREKLVHAAQAAAAQVSR